MKSTLTLILSLFLGMHSYSQINIGAMEMPRMNAGHFTSASIAKLKASTTLFVYRESDKDKLDQLQKILDEVWSFTEIKMISYDELSEYPRTDKYSFFTLGGFVTERSEFGGVNSYSNTHHYLTLWMNKKPGAKGKLKKETYCRIEMHPTFDTYGKSTKTAIAYMYDGAHIHNWTMGFLKNYLQIVNDHLTDGKERWLWLKARDAVKLRKLKTSTLYIPNYILVQFGAWTGDESKRHKEEELLKSYKYKYEFIDRDTLSNKILNSTKPIFYLIYIKSSTDKYITIVNSLTGEIIYSKYKAVSYNIKPGDFYELNKFIK